MGWVDAVAVVRADYSARTYSKKSHRQLLESQLVDYKLQPEPSQQRFISFDENLMWPLFWQQYIKLLAYTLIGIGFYIYRPIFV